MRAHVHVPGLPVGPAERAGAACKQPTERCPRAPTLSLTLSLRRGSCTCLRGRTRPRQWRWRRWPLGTARCSCSATCTPQPIHSCQQMLRGLVLRGWNSDGRPASSRHGLEHRGRMIRERATLLDRVPTWLRIDPNRYFQRWQPASVLCPAVQRQLCCSRAVQHVMLGRHGPSGRQQAYLRLVPPRSVNYVILASPL